MYKPRYPHSNSNKIRQVHIDVSGPVDVPERLERAVDKLVHGHVLLQSLSLGPAALVGGRRQVGRGPEGTGLVAGAGELDGLGDVARVGGADLRVELDQRERRGVVEGKHLWGAPDTGRGRGDGVGYDTRMTRGAGA